VEVRGKTSVANHLFFAIFSHDDLGNTSFATRCLFTSIIIIIIFTTGCSRTDISYPNELAHGESYSGKAYEDDCKSIPLCDHLYRLYPEEVKYCCYVNNSGMEIRNAEYHPKD
jgi:hypothetical protein